MAQQHWFLLAVISIATLTSACSGPQAPTPSGDAAGAPFARVDLSAYLDCAREQGVTLLQAHRAGDRPGAAENSLGAIDASLDDGAVFLEIDVSRTRDGVLVLMHDESLERTTTGGGLVAAQTFADLAPLTLRDLHGRSTGEPVPTLAAALRALDGRGFAQLDRKRPTPFDEILSEVAAADALDRVMVITYTVDEAISVHRQYPSVMLSTGIDDLDDVARLRDAAVDLSRVTAWLGLGAGRPELDRELTALGIETSYGDFRAEREGTVDYMVMAANGAEILSVDEMSDAGAILDAAAVSRRLLENCPRARG